MLKSVSKANSRDLIRRTLLPFHVSRYQQLTKCIRERDEGGDEEMSKKEGGGGGGRRREREEDMYTSLSIFLFVIIILN